MFTGIIKKIGTVKKIDKKVDGIYFEFDTGDFSKDLKTGSSIAVDGVCLTVVSISNTIIGVDVISETLKRTTISDYREGSMVNLEKPMNFSEGLDGHLVQGHIDGTATILIREESNDNVVITFTMSAKLTKSVVEKGSIAIDGISMTVVEAHKETVSVALIPYTIQNTTLGSKKKGDKVNIETDIIGKYVGKYFSDSNGSKAVLPVYRQ